jgi:phosphatidylglycerol:prolipoprotein diacylglycerol transferase
MEITLKHNSSVILKKTLEVGFYVVVFALSIPAFFYLLGHLLDRIFNPFSLNRATLEFSGITLIGLGGSIMILAIIELGKYGRGLPASPVPPTMLLTEGLYGLSRHPIYFGASISFLGGSLFLDSFWSVFLSWPLFTLFFMTYAQRVEEPVLEQRFNGDYHSYKKDVPMFWEFPLREKLLHALSQFLGWASSIVNRPFILEYRSHLLFLGYGLWVGFGVFLGCTVLNIALVTDNIPASTTAWMIFFFTVASLTGSRFVSMIVTMILEQKTLKKAWHRVGFVSWGALLAAILSSGLFYLLTKKNLYYWFDASLTGLMINHFFGRIGCLFYGCCYGKETRADIHVHYTHPRLKAIREGHVKSGTLYPTQIYSALYGLITFFVLIFMWIGTSIRVGVPTSICFILYGMFRFVEEWYRYQKRVIAGILSPAQIVCMILILIGVLHLGWILPALNPGIHIPLFRIPFGEIFKNIHIWLVFGMGLLTTFVFSYHRYEIGCWGKLGRTQNQDQGGGHGPGIQKR